MMPTLLTKSIESTIKTAISEATVGLHKKIETQEKEISDLKAESSQIKIENRRLNDNVFDLMVDIEELEQRMTDRHYYRELKTGYQDFRVVAVVIRLSNPFFHHRAQKTILLVLYCRRY
jgi:predicted nuclease with TOPRIM domain